LTSGDERSKSDPGPGIRTFLFADIRGYTRFIVEQGDAAGVRMVDRFGAAAREAVGPHRGEIIGLAGDEAVAVFASARDALRSALDFQRRVADATARDPDVPLLVGIGLDTGEAVPAGGNYVGAALNLAARLCKLAGPSEVLASEAVVHVASKIDGIGYVERGLAQLKGFRDPVRVFKVLDEVRPLGPAAETGRLEAGHVPPEPPPPIGGFLGALPATELVAREPELGRALVAADSAIGGAGRFVLLAGEPGVGKTRLAQEIMLTIRNRRFLVATGRCYQTHQPVPFYPFLDALTSAYRLAPPSVRALVLERWRHLSRLLPELKAEVAPPLSSTPEEQQLLFREVTAFLEAVAAETPVAILIDDLHWADSATLELLQHIARHTRASRILLVATFRDVEVGRHHPLDAALRDLTREDLVERITVRRLEPTGTARLVALTLGESDASPELVELLHQHADGNPFFTQQLLRFLVERGDLYRRDGVWVERPLRRLEVPDSVRSVIGQRMERLSEPAPQILREAAVLGQTFSFSALVGLSGRPEAEVERSLEEAQATGLLEERRPDLYAFDHALTQQALYGELSPRRRRALHLAAAEALERLPAAERAPRSAELAGHFLEAAQEERAIPFALAAGDLARSVFASGPAERQYTIALEIAERTHRADGEADALGRRARLYLDTFRGPPGLADSTRLLELARQRGDRALELRALLLVSEASYIVALDATTPELLAAWRLNSERAQTLADELGNEPAKVEALLKSRWMADFFPEYRPKVQENLRTALEVSRRLGDPDLTLASELALWGQGDRLEAEARATRLVRQLRDRRDFGRLNLLYFSMMWAYLEWAEFAKAIEACDAGIRLAEEIGVPPVQYPTLRAFALIELGRFAEARESLRQEVADAEHPFGQAMQLLGLGMYFFELRDFGRAEQTFRDQLERAKRLRRAWMARWSLEYIARARLREGRLDPSDWEALEQEMAPLANFASDAVRAEVALARGDAETALGVARQVASRAEAEEEIRDLMSAREVEIRALLGLGRAHDAAALAERLARDLSARQARSRAWRAFALRATALAAAHDAPAAQEARLAAGSIVRELAESIPEAESRRAFLTSPEVRDLL